MGWGKGKGWQGSSSSQGYGWQGDEMTGNGSSGSPPQWMASAYYREKAKRETLEAQAAAAEKKTQDEAQEMRLASTVASTMKQALQSLGFGGGNEQSDGKTANPSTSSSSASPSSGENSLAVMIQSALGGVIGSAAAPKPQPSLASADIANMMKLIEAQKTMNMQDRNPTTPTKSKKDKKAKYKKRKQSSSSSSSPSTSSSGGKRRKKTSSKERPSSGKKRLKGIDDLGEVPQQNEAENMADKKMIETVAQASVQMIMGKKAKFSDYGCEGTVAEWCEMMGKKVPLQTINKVCSANGVTCSAKQKKSDKVLSIVQMLWE